MYHKTLSDILAITPENSIIFLIEDLASKADFACVIRISL